MAECMADRLSAQEEQIRLLYKEISLRDGLTRGLDAVDTAGVSPELESLRAENEKLQYRLLHLRRGLRTELELEEGAAQQGVKFIKAPVKNTSSKEQQTNNRADEKVLWQNIITQFKCVMWRGGEL